MAALRRALVDELKREGHIQSPRVEAAFRAVPRELFVPGVPLEEVYRASEAIVTKWIDGVGVSSASAPDVIAIMLEQLRLEPGQRVLEIGAGTGYNAALLAHIVGEAGRVVTLDIDQDLVQGARERLARAGFGAVQVVCEDGALGYPAAAPYARIMLSVAAGEIAPAWREQLARSGGRLVLPLGLRGPQRSVAFEHAGDHLASVSIRSCSFIPLRGALAEAPARVPLGPGGGLALGLPDQPLPVEAAALFALLERGPSREWPTGVRARMSEVSEGLGLWLAVREAGVCSLWAEAGAAGGALVPELLGRPGRWRATIGLLDETGLALLARRAGGPSPDQAPASELVVRGFGPSEALAQRLLGLATAWDATGRPSDRGLRIRAYPAGAPVQPPGAAVIERRWTRLVVDWG